MLKSNEEITVVNDYIENDPLSENNLDKTLDLVNKIRLSCTQKSIWLYTGFTWENIFDIKSQYHQQNQAELSMYWKMRQQILANCDVIIDGRYIEQQRDITLKWRGSKNQRVINAQKSLQKGKIILWET